MRVPCVLLACVLYANAQNICREFGDKCADGFGCCVMNDGTDLGLCCRKGFCQTVPDPVFGHAYVCTNYTTSSATLSAPAPPPGGPCPKAPANYCDCGIGVNTKWFCRANNGYVWETNDEHPVDPCPAKYPNCTTHPGEITILQSSIKEIANPHAADQPICSAKNHSMCSEEEPCCVGSATFFPVGKCCPEGACITKVTIAGPVNICNASLLNTNKVYGSALVYSAAGGFGGCIDADTKAVYDALPPQMGDATYFSDYVAKLACPQRKSNTGVFFNSSIQNYSNNQARRYCDGDDDNCMH